VVTGAVDDGRGLEAFARKQWQVSGDDMVASVRGGASGRRYRGGCACAAGSYWEPGRFTGVGGRPHLTAGLELGFYTFRFWGSKHRLRLSLTGDVARRYGNAGVSAGFWH
jgi:hypothetical protein